MKFLLPLIAILMLTSCLDTVNFSKENPFVVVYIFNNGEHCEYRNTEGTGIFRDVIIADCGLYQIGDTIKLQNQGDTIK